MCQSVNFHPLQIYRRKGSQILSKQNLICEYKECYDSCCDVTVCDIDAADGSCDEEIQPQDLSISYFAGYLATLGLREHPCNNCRDAIVQSHKTLEYKRDIFIFWKAYETRDQSDMGNLSVPSPDFFNVVKSQVVACTAFVFKHKHIHDLRIKTEAFLYALTDREKPDWFQHPTCKQHRLDILRRLIRVKLFYSMKLFTRDLNSLDKRRKSNKTNRDGDMLKNLEISSAISILSLK